MESDIIGKKELIPLTTSIKDKIHILRNVQIILDRDLAELYNIETRALKQAVNRNKKRFPEDFMFALTEKEAERMVSQNVIPSKKYFGGSLPYAFTEQGIANLSSVLNSEKAIEVNIQIMRAFVQMRRFLSANAQVFQRLDTVETKLVDHDRKFEQVFKAIEDKGIKPDKGIFFDGQIFDAYKFVSDLVRSAKKSIVLIDNYVDDTVLTLLSKRSSNVDATIFTKEVSNQLLLDLKKHNQQYPPVAVKKFGRSHDRFMIIDDKEAYHLGASLKDLGKKWFAFSKFDKDAFKMLERIK